MDVSEGMRVEGLKVIVMVMLVLFGGRVALWESEWGVRCVVKGDKRRVY